jgi:hypothetical protein
VFETVPSEGHKQNLIYCFSEEIRERDKDMKGINESEK